MRQRISGALMMAGAIGIVLLIQAMRSSWPFDRTPARSADDVVGTVGEAPASARAAVDASTPMFAQLGVRVEPVRREPVVRSIRTIATVVPDESRLSHVHTRVAGWLEQLDVNTTGQMVRAGQPLARIFSQELLSSQTEYLAARSRAATGLASVVVDGGRARLRVLGMTDAEIEEIERTGQPRRLVTVVAPRTGVVVQRSVSAGTAVDPSTELLTIADLSRVWVFAEVPEKDIRGIRAGSSAVLEFPGASRTAMGGRVEFMYPTLSEETRTLRVRFSVPNGDGSLRPGLYGSATFELTSGDALTVPRDAVVDTGVQQHVFVAAGGRFEPRVVSVGARMADRVEILSGLSEGEQVVSSGVFLLDSESRLRASGGAGTHQHGAPPEKPAPAPSAKPAAKPAGPAVDPHAGHR